MRLPRRPLFWILAIACLPVIAYALLLLTTRPRGDRLWADDQARAATVETKGNLVIVHDLRDFQYVGTTKVVQQFRDQTYDADKIMDVSFLTSPFKTLPSAAHTFFSFRFDSGQTLAVSVEARREKDEAYSTWKGALRQYELLYVWGTERDLVRLRAVAREDKIEMFKTALTPAQGKALLLALARQSEQARTSPRFYNTLVSNCTTEAFRALNAALGTSLPTWGTRMILSAKTPETLAEAGLIKDTIDHAKADKTATIRSISNDAKFSERLRQAN